MNIFKNNKSLELENIKLKEEQRIDKLEHEKALHNIKINFDTKFAESENKIYALEIKLQRKESELSANKEILDSIINGDNVSKVLSDNYKDISSKYATLVNEFNHYKTIFLRMIIKL